jgi:ElaB/YqjD/DUF883 family membrane-anchored ribosome-binding protein/sulfur transfer complex TusBCD TusB component (DsrH family)
MNCKKCGFKLVDGQDICPRCSTSQSAPEENVGGVSMELPPMGEPAKKAKPSGAGQEPKAQPKKSDQSKKTFKDTAEKAKKEVKKTAKKVKKASKETAENIKETAGEAAENVKKSGSKSWLYVIIAVGAAAVLIIAGYFVVTYSPSGGDEQPSVMLAASDDTVYLLDNGKLTELAEIPEGLEASRILRAVDDSSFYLVADAEYDEDADDVTGDLVYIKANGKEVEIDSDVVMGSLQIAGKVLWYEKADDADRIICCYDGRNAEEIVDEEELDDWVGTDKAGKVYYTLYDEEDDSSEAYIAEKGDSDSIADDVWFFIPNEDFSKVLFFIEDKDEINLMIYDGKDDFDVIDDYQNILMDIKTFDMAVVADDEDKTLYYIPYGKEEIELDDEVSEILIVPNLSGSGVVEKMDDTIYYGKDGDLYAADIKGKDTEKILKDYNEVGILYQDADAREIAYVDDDEVVWLNVDTYKETSVELPDADELTTGEVELVGSWYVYFTEEGEELYAYDGRHDPIELTDDGDEITGFEGFMDKYVLWTNEDGELVISAMKEDSAEEIGDELYGYKITDEGEIYFLSDYDNEDQEGDLYYIPRVGKEAERVEKNIKLIFRLFYEK